MVLVRRAARKGFMASTKKQIHLALTERTYDALSLCAHDIGSTRTYVIKRALQVFLLKGDYYRKAVNK